MKMPSFTVSFTFKNKTFANIQSWLEKYAVSLIAFILTALSAILFISYYQNGLGLSYNDARSHLDIGRRVVEGLKPGLAQLGSVWLPLPHLLMIPTVWNDFMWHSGLAGALQSMISFIITGLLVYKILETLRVGHFGRIIGVLVFIANLNVLYLQSIAMTELLLLVTMTAGSYYLILWHKEGKLLNIIKASFWVMLSSLVRYDGWFLLLLSGILVIIHTFRKKGYKAAEGMFIIYCTLAAFGIALWFIWNKLIFGDALYFIFGPFSARAQQAQLEQAGILVTKGNLWLSLKIYLYALFYNSYTLPAVFGLFGAFVLWTDKRLSSSIRIATSVLFAPFLFNVLALYMGHSVLFIQGISGNTWFNVRYGILMMPSIAIFIGYLVHRLPSLRWVLVGLLAFVTFFAFANYDAVTIDDARVGSSQKNVSEVSGWLKEHAGGGKGFILISAASHDAIIFSSGLPMKRFIHEGTGAYWESATTSPDRWARWIVMRTHDDNDLTWKSVSRTPGFAFYEKQASYPFADVYELKREYLGQLNTEPILGKQK